MENFIDGISYILTNKKYDNNGNMIYAEINAHSKEFNIYTQSPEKMMNRICSHINKNLIPDYSSNHDDHISKDNEKREYISFMSFKVYRKI